MTSKIIPIPLFLVSFFMNGGILQSALTTCQAFHTSIFNMAPTDLQDCIQHVKNFLIVVTGGHPQVSMELLMMSQLAIKMEIIMVD